jgi:hypothetical protein
MSDDEGGIEDLDDLDGEIEEDEEINIKNLSDNDSDVESVEDDEEEPAPKIVVKKVRTDPVIQNANKTVDIIVIPPDERITSDHLQLPEIARLISIRAAHIDAFGAGSLDVKGLTSSEAIARLEITDRIMPLMVRREIGVTENGSTMVELWDPNTMVHPIF